MLLVCYILKPVISIVMGVQWSYAQKDTHVNSCPKCKLRLECPILTVCGLANHTGIGCKKVNFCHRKLMGPSKGTMCVRISTIMSSSVIFLQKSHCAVACHDDCTTVLRITKVFTNLLKSPKQTILGTDLGRPRSWGAWPHSFSLAK